MPARKPRLLVTGFGPFPGMPRNPSAALAERVAASPRWRRLGVEVRVAILTTGYAALARDLTPTIREAGADAILMLGVAGRARRLRIETRALNRASILAPDAEGRRPVTLAFEPGGLIRRSRAPATTAAVLLRRTGWRVRLSQDAGRYLCNAAYWRALARAEPTLFVHIPKPPRRRPITRSGAKAGNRQAALTQAFTDLGLALLRQARATGGPPRLD